MARWRKKSVVRIYNTETVMEMRDGREMVNGQARASRRTKAMGWLYSQEEVGSIILVVLRN